MKENNDFFKEYISSSKPLSKQEVNKLITLAQQGDKEARDLLIHHNIKLVKSIALKYSKTIDDIDELIQEGVIGLIKAIKCFNIDKECNFSTYATPCINREIIKYLIQNSPIHFSSDILNLMYKIKKYINNYTEQNHQNPTLKQISETLSIDEIVISEIIKMDYNFRNIKSLDAPVGEDKSITIKDFVEDERQNLLENIIDKMWIELLRDEISKLPEIEREVINLIFNQGKNKSESARILNTNTNKINNLERKAILTLRKNLEKHKD